jgi:acyl-CoA hydrolase
MAGTQRETTLRFMTEPADVNFGGKVHGGVVMKWIDQAGYACAVGWSGSYCVTVYVGSIRFERPIMIGQMVEVRARLIMTGTTSMHLSVEVAAQDLLSGERFEATRCVIVFVAVDSQGKPTKVPPWVPLSDEDKLLADYAAKLMRLREGIEERLQTGAAKP